MPVFETVRDVEAVAGSSNRKFGLVLCAALCAVGLWPLLHGHDVRWWAIAIGIALGAAAVAWPAALSPLNAAWTKLGLLLGKVVTPIVMAVLLYVVLAPFGIIQRLAGRDQLRLKRDANAKSYWEFRNPPGPPPASMNNQF